MTKAGLNVAARGILAAGSIMLILERLSKIKKSKASWPMIAVGLVGTVPLALSVINNVKEARHAVAEAA